MAGDFRCEHVYETLRSRILTDRYHAGQKLSENALAEEFGCSRTPIREMLQRLEADGLVVIKAKSGTYVRQETREDFEELMEVRAYLESLAFRLALPRVTAGRLRKMETCKRAMDAVVSMFPIDMVRFATMHYKFHLELIRISGSQLLGRLYARLNLRSSHMFYQFMDSDMALVTEDEHERILEFLRTGDPTGEEFMRRHLWNKMERMWPRSP